MAEEEARNESRQPRNLQGLLRFAVEAGASPSSALSTLSQEEVEQRRRFLDTVLSSFSVDVAGIMKKAISILLTPETEIDSNEVDSSEKVNALNQLMEWVDNLDFATDFQKIGGFSILHPCLKSEHAVIRQKTAELIAELVQNHPYCQKAATDAKVLEPLVRLLDVDSDVTVRVKCLYAVSALLQHNPEAQDDFLKLDGFSVILRALQSDVEKLIIKSAFLSTALCAERSAFKDTLCDQGFVEQFVSLIQQEHNDTQEHIVSALLSLVSNHPAGIKECQREEFNLKETLTVKIRLLQGNEQYQEELDYCQKLLATCFNSGEGECQPQDR